MMVHASATTRAGITRARLRALLGLCTFALLALAGCGQTGPLELPQDAEAASPATGAPEDSARTERPREDEP